MVEPNERCHKPVAHGNICGEHAAVYVYNDRRPDEWGQYCIAHAMGAVQRKMPLAIEGRARIVIRKWDGNRPPRRFGA